MIFFSMHDFSSLGLNRGCPQRLFFFFFFCADTKVTSLQTDMDWTQFSDPFAESHTCVPRLVAQTYWPLKKPVI